MYAGFSDSENNAIKIIAFMIMYSCMDLLLYQFNKFFNMNQIIFSVKLACILCKFSPSS